MKAWARAACAAAGAAVSCACAPSFYDAVPPGGPVGARYADVEGAHVRYVDVGEGPAVVLVHGFASSLDAWKALVPELAKSHRVVALDLKGFGWSSRPEGDYSPSAEARVVAALMNDRGLSRAAIVGHSWGASVALALAIEAPDRVSRLVLYDAWVYEEQLPTTFLWARAGGVGEALFDLFYAEQPDAKMARAFYDPDAHLDERLVEDVDRALDRPGTTAAALAAVRGQRYADVQSRYARVSQPALLLWGREDGVTLLPFGERLARDLPHARLVTYPRCGHFPMIEAASESNADVVAFLAEEKAP